MVEIRLYTPKILSSTGNIIRLCVNTGIQFHLIHPLDLDLESKKLRKFVLDYHKFSTIVQHKNFEGCIKENSNKYILTCTTKANKYYRVVKFQTNDILFLGSETPALS